MRQPILLLTLIRSERLQYLQYLLYAIKPKMIKVIIDGKFNALEGYYK